MFICNDCSQTWDDSCHNHRCVECRSDSYEEVIWDDDLELYLEDKLDEDNPLCYNEEGELVGEFNILKRKRVFNGCY